jgi:hypothetical protein
MDDVFGGMFAIGKSYKQKEMYLNEMKKQGYDKFVTLDLSGFDQSHTESMSLVWNSFIEDIIELAPQEILKYCSLEEFREIHCKRHRKIIFEYMDPVTKVPVYLWTLNVMDKLCSGSAFTSTKNTLTMLVQCLYVAYFNNMDIVPHAAGDDVLCHTKSIYTDEMINEAFYSVFQPKDCPQERWGNGLILKYCSISENIEDIKPCSTEVYECKNCGYKILRPFYKVVQSIQCSHKYASYFKTGMPLDLYKQVIKSGDKAWYSGIPLYEAVYDQFLPLESELRMKPYRIENYIMSAAAKVLKPLNPEIPNYYRKESSVIYLKDYYRKISMFKGETYFIDRVNSGVTCEECINGFNRMFKYNYGENPLTTITALKCMGDIVNFDWLNMAISYYKKRQSQLEKPPDPKIIKYLNKYFRYD